MDTRTAREQVAGAVAALINQPGFERLVAQANCHRPPSPTLRLVGRWNPEARRWDFSLRF